jgi:hypothetical protein
MAPEVAVAVEWSLFPVITIEWPLLSVVTIEWPLLSVVTIEWPLLSVITVEWPLLSVVTVEWPLFSALKLFLAPGWPTVLFATSLPAIWTSRSIVRAVWWSFPSFNAI